MGRLPSFVLRNRVTLTPYLGVWGVYGQPVAGIRCVVQERPATAAGGAGVPRARIFTVIGQLDEPLGAAAQGSILDLEDGWRGYISSAVRHEMRGLPTPNHVEVTLEVPDPIVPPALGGETVAVLRRVPDGEDRYGNTRYVSAETAVTAAVRQLPSSEQHAAALGTGRDQITDMIEVILPPGTEVSGIDRLRVRGLVYEVEGKPVSLRDPMTGADPGYRTTGRRTQG